MPPSRAALRLSRRLQKRRIAQGVCNLLTAASAVFELDGEREGDWLRSSDYGRAGRIAASNCDLLIAIWDGRPGEGGGTAEIARGATLAKFQRCGSTLTGPKTLPSAPGTTNGKPTGRPRSSEPCLRLSSRRLGRRMDAALFRRKGREPDDDTRADTLASRYGHLYRASYRLKTGLAALAVLFAVAV